MYQVLWLTHDLTGLLATSQLPHVQNQKGENLNTLASSITGTLQTCHCSTRFTNKVSAKIIPPLSHTHEGGCEVQGTSQTKHEGASSIH